MNRSRSKRGTGPVDKVIGRNLRDLRIARGMSQTALGDRLGLTFQQIQKYEKGANRIAASTLYDMTRILEVTFGEFFKENEQDEALDDDADVVPQKVKAA